MEKDYHSSVSFCVHLMNTFVYQKLLVIHPSVSGYWQCTIDLSLSAALPADNVLQMCVCVRVCVRM